MTFKTYEGPPVTFRVEHTDIPQEVHRVTDVYECFLDGEGHALMPPTCTTTLTADGEGGVDIVVTAGDKQARANITKTCIQRAQIWPALRRLAKMLAKPKPSG